MRRTIFCALCLLVAAPAFADDFKGYACTVDCSGHKAGYEWAEQKAISSFL